MPRSSFIPPVDGLIPPLATPLRGPGVLDPAGLDALNARVIDAGVDGVFVLGTTGEAPSLSPGVKRDVIAGTCEAAAGRVPVLVGLLETSTSEALGLAEHSAKCGATAVVVTPPFYFGLDEFQIVEWAQRTIPQMPLPVYFYNIPDRTRAVMSPDAIAECLRVPGVVGFKDSSGNLEAFRRIVPTAPKDIGLFWGPEERLWEAMKFGVTGGICGGANLFPSLYISLYRAAREGDDVRAAELQIFIDRISNEIYSAATYGSGYIMGMKYALGLSGIGNCRAEEPLGELDAASRAKIEHAFEDISSRLAATPALTTR